MIKNIVNDLGNIVEIIPNGKHSDKIILLDKSDLSKLGNNTVVVTKDNYAVISKDGKKVKIHNLVTTITTDRKNVIDHKNGNRLDNRGFNLRAVTQRANARNKHNCSLNSTGTIGVSERSRGNYSFFRAQVTLPDSSLGTSGQGKRLSKNFKIEDNDKQKALDEATTWITEKKKEICY